MVPPPKPFASRSAPATALLELGCRTRRRFGLDIGRRQKQDWARLKQQSSRNYYFSHCQHSHKKKIYFVSQNHEQTTVWRLRPRLRCQSYADARCGTCTITVVVSSARPWQSKAKCVETTQRAPRDLSAVEIRDSTGTFGNARLLGRPRTSLPGMPCSCALSRSAPC